MRPPLASRAILKTSTHEPKKLNEIETFQSFLWGLKLTNRLSRSQLVEPISLLARTIRVTLSYVVDCSRLESWPLAVSWSWSQKLRLRLAASWAHSFELREFEKDDGYKLCHLTSINHRQTWVGGRRFQNDVADVRVGVDPGVGVAGVDGEHLALGPGDGAGLFLDEGKSERINWRVLLIWVNLTLACCWQSPLTMSNFSIVSLA